MKLSSAGIEMCVRYLFILLSVIAGVQYYLQGNNVRVVSSLLTIFLFMLPSLAQLLLRVTLPTSYRMIFLVFIIVAMYLGELHNFFYRFSWWDDWVHTSTGMLLTYVGVLLAFVISKDGDLHRHAGALFVAVFCLCFTMAFSAVWELFEFSVDKTLGLNLQKGRVGMDMSTTFDGARALLNTMQDIAVSLLGAVIVSVIAFLSLRKHKDKEPVFLRLIKQFVQQNPRLF